MRALLPLLSVCRGWRVGAAARPPRRVMSLYRTEERGHPHSQDYRLFFSKWLAEFRAGPRSSRAAGLRLMGVRSPRPAWGDGGRVSARSADTQGGAGPTALCSDRRRPAAPRSTR